jgi:hypothetical protein
VPPRPARPQRPVRWPSFVSWSRRLAGCTVARSGSSAPAGKIVDAAHRVGLTALAEPEPMKSVAAQSTAQWPAPEQSTANLGSGHPRGRRRTRRLLGVVALSPDHSA